MTHSASSNTPTLPPLTIGEVLFDHFAAGRNILGGAPFNAAWNLRGFGMQPTLVSEVSDDVDGKRIRERMTDWNMDLRDLPLQQVLDRAVAFAARICGIRGATNSDANVY